MTKDYNGHTLRYKDSEGNWHDIPVLYQTMYEAYRSYCIANNIAYVSQAVYCQALVDIVKLADTVSEQGIVSVENGGTGASNVKAARTNLGVYSKDETEELVKKAIYGDSTQEEEAGEDSLIARVKNLETQLTALSTALNKRIDGISLQSLGLTAGSGDPGANTPGSVYFKII